MTAPSTTAPAFAFWFRRDKRHPWRKIAGGVAEDEAWAALFRFDGSGDKLVSQRDPNTEKKTR